MAGVAGGTGDEAAMKEPAMGETARDGGADFRAVALAAWNEYKSTGLHATEVEADAWLARLEAGENAEAPVCHL